MKISICCPSYKRPKVKTLEYLPFAKVYVDGSEFEEYKRENPEAEIVRCDDGIQGNLARVRNYILDTEFGNGMDVVGMSDDDLSGVFYWEKKKQHRLETDEFLDWVERYSFLAEELGAYMWGINVNSDKSVYREYSPFSTLSFPYGPLRFFLKDDIRIREDERLPLKEDYDMFLQQLYVHRKILRLNKYFANAKIAEGTGGSAVRRNYNAERKQLELLTKKWGSGIVKPNQSLQNHRGKKRNENNFNFNPIVKVPIKGI